MKTFKVIKVKEFDTNGTKGTNYTVALSGRVLNVSSLSFQDEDKDVLKYDAKLSTLTINCGIEVTKRPYLDALGNSVMGLSVMPEFGLQLSDV